jgi:hypothetical protein
MQYCEDTSTAPQDWITFYNCVISAGSNCTSALNCSVP